MTPQADVRRERLDRLIEDVLCVKDDVIEFFPGELSDVRAGLAAAADALREARSAS